VPPRKLLITDCVLRSLTFATLGVLAVTDQLTLQVLIIGLLFGATFRMAGSSSRRLLATSMAGETGRFAVNGLLGLNATFALYIVGPVLGGVIVATTSAGVALFFDACGALVLLAAFLISVPRAVRDRDARRRPTSPESGWRILRRRPVAEPSAAAPADRDHRPVGGVPDRTCLRWQSDRRDDRLWTEGTGAWPADRRRG
jgi:MFS family permease